jgi:hypothetical protein
VASVTDRTADMQEAAGEEVISAVRTEPGRIEVLTDIADP